MEAKKGGRPSWFRSSVIEGRNLLCLGARWNVSMGNNMRIWEDPWLPVSSNFFISSPKASDCDLSVVADLIATVRDFC